MTRPVLHATGDASELVPYLPVTKSSPYKRVVVFSVPVGPLAVGDIIVALCEWEVTNDLGYNVMVASQMVLAPTRDAVAGAEVTEANGYNVTPAMHHGIVSKVGMLAVTRAMASAHVNVVAYAASSRAPVTGTRLTVMRDYGRLSVLRFPAA